MNITYFLENELAAYVGKNENKKYVKVIQELIATEVSFFVDIDLIVENYLKPYNESKWSTEYKDIFGNIEVIAQFSRSWRRTHIQKGV